MTMLQAREAPQPVRYEDSRLAGVRRLEAGSGRFPGMCVFPHSGAITVWAVLLLFLSPFCLYRGSLFWLHGTRRRRANLGSTIAGTHYKKLMGFPKCNYVINLPRERENLVWGLAYIAGIPCAITDGLPNIAASKCHSPLSHCLSFLHSGYRKSD